MTFRCQTCGFAGQKFIGGKCPACGSFNVVALERARKLERPPVRKPFRLALAVAIWILFGWVLYSRYFS